MQPIYVAFSVPQRNLPPIREEMAQRELPVTAQALGRGKPELGKLAYVDNAVDSTTGTIMLRAIFDNKKERLWPGQFANTTLTLRVEPDAHRRSGAGGAGRAGIELRLCRKTGQDGGAAQRQGRPLGQW